MELFDQISQRWKILSKKKKSDMTMMNYNAVANIHTKFNELLSSTYRLLELMQGVEFGDECNIVIENIKKIMRSEGANI